MFANSALYVRYRTVPKLAVLLIWANFEHWLYLSLFLFDVSVALGIIFDVRTLYPGIHVARFTSTLTMSSWWGATAQTTARTRRGEIPYSYSSEYNDFLMRCSVFRIQNKLYPNPDPDPGFSLFNLRFAVEQKYWTKK